MRPHVELHATGDGATGKSHLLDLIERHAPAWGFTVVGKDGDTHRLRLQRADMPTAADPRHDPAHLRELLSRALDYVEVCRDDSPEGTAADELAEAIAALGITAAAPAAHGKAP